LPLYVYRCDDCGTQVEIKQSFNDAPLTTCESCRGRLRRVIQPSTVIYKGSGFYCTDNRSNSGGNGRNGSSTKTESSSASTNAGKDSTDSKASEPAKAEANKD
jgi:putative FmdB family regulatory protein